MKNKHITILLIVLALIVIFFTIGFSQIKGEAQETIHISIGTASVGGAWYPIGIQLSKIWNDAGMNIKAVAQATAGSPQNIDLLREKDVQVAIIRDQECYRAI